MSRFEERLAQDTPIVADGGMGALLSSAVSGLRCPEEANIRAPESVLEVHLGYIRAGAELIETNSFGANRAKLARRFLADELEAINAAAVRIAREAREVAGRDVFIAGSIGPLGDTELARQEPAELYAEQARILEGRGVDVFMVETFYDLDELETAIAAVRSVSALPIVALLTFDAGGETLAGVKAEDAAATLQPLGLAAYGANHGAGPAAALTALAQMSGDGAVLAALPNVGLASMSGQRIVFPHATPAYFAEFAAQARALGARLIGGCCGTTPAQVAAIREAVDANRRPAGSFLVQEREQVAPFEPATGETQLGATAARRRVRPLGPGRSAARSESRGADRDGARRSRLGPRAVRRRQRQPARAGTDERNHGVGRDRAVHGRRDDPAPDAARHDDHRPRVAAARRARRGRAEHPRGHGRPARGGRLPRHPRRLRRRLDRARRADREAQRRARTGTGARSTRRPRSSRAPR